MKLCSQKSPLHAFLGMTRGLNPLLLLIGPGHLEETEMDKKYAGH
jgi:hypothetical protein